MSAKPPRHREDMEPQIPQMAQMKKYLLAASA